MNVTKFFDIDGLLSARGGNGVTNGGGGSGGSIWIYCHTLRGYGEISTNGGNAAGNAGGGAAGRIAMYFWNNITFTNFSYTAKGGKAGAKAEAGGPGTSFIFHREHNHRTLIVSNGNQKPLMKHIDYGNILKDGGKAWVMPESGIHRFADSAHKFHFEELQVYKSAHLAIWPTTGSNNVSIFFMYMIGDRTGRVHVAANQTLDLQRPEIDLPFNLHIYKDGFAGLAPRTEIHGVEIIISGVLAYVKNLTMHHKGQLWLLHGGRTWKHTSHNYQFDFVRVQDTAKIHAVTSPVNDPGISFTTKSVSIEGGGLVRATKFTFVTENITIVAGGSLIADYLGYNTSHGLSDSGMHGLINPGHGFYSRNGGSGAGHGGRGGRGNIANGASFTGAAYGDIYEPNLFGSVGGKGAFAGRGGNGGGILWFNVTNRFEVDGLVTANGEAGPERGAGGGSGGSVWIFCHELAGRGMIQAKGGSGSFDASVPGGGGSGGRIAVYFNVNKTGYSFTYRAQGGAALGCQKGREDLCKAEAGGPGTAFLYHMIENHRTLFLHNDYQKPLVSAIMNYNSTHDDGCKAWVVYKSGRHAFANGKDDFHFEELQIYAGAHFAILTNPPERPASLFFRHMIGDRTGTIHVGPNQVMDLKRDEIDLPFSVHNYERGYLGLAPYTEVHGVTIFNSGTLAHIKNLTIHHGGELWMNHGGRTVNESASNYVFDAMRIQDSGAVRGLTKPLIDPGIFLQTRSLVIEGGGLAQFTRLRFKSENLTIDDGGLLTCKGLGYNHTHGAATGLLGIANIGIGGTSATGSSGGGFGGSAGRGKGALKTGQPYGDLYEPKVYGSCGGGAAVSGSGGGIMWMNITDTMFIDGELAAGGNSGTGLYGGGGSGGSQWLYANKIKGTGRLSAVGGNGGAQSGGGAGGRIALYFKINDTFTGKFQNWGGSGNPEPGGAGTTFLYHQGYKHRTLHVDNNKQKPYVERIANYDDLSQDGCRVWILPVSGNHLLASGTHNYHFEELQIYGSAHLAVLPHIAKNASIFFKHMIGDRSGMIHVGKYQTMNLQRHEIDTPFSSYVYQHGYLGLATYTSLHSVAIHLEGDLEHVVHLTLMIGGILHIHPTGSTYHHPDSHCIFNGTVRVKADSKIITHSMQAHSRPFLINANVLQVDGGGRIDSFHMKVTAINMTVDDGGVFNANEGLFPFCIHFLFRDPLSFIFKPSSFKEEFLLLLSLLHHLASI